MQSRQPATRPVLGAIFLGVFVFWPAGCDTAHPGLRLVPDAGLTDRDSSGGAAGSAGGAGLGTGGSGATGGTQSIGTAGSIGGEAAGGLASSGGAVSTSGAVSTGGAVTVAPATVAESGFVTVSTGTVQLSGYIASSTAGSGSSISLTYGSDEFCATGVVAPNSTYKSWAVTGFNVNQQASGASGSTQSLALVGTTISLRYVNRGGTTLEFQLFDGSQYWCYYLPPAPESTTFSFPLANLNTQCWDGLGAAFQSGTPIVSVNLAVPGASSSKTPFDYCFQGMSVD